jgi:Mg2+ and Co2+ transporter CorA
LSDGTPDDLGWDGKFSRPSRSRYPWLTVMSIAVILVDPAFAATCAIPPTKPANPDVPTFNGVPIEPSELKTLDDCLILQAEKPFKSRSALWRAQDWGATHPLQGKSHRSWPYHNGCSTLAPLIFSEVGMGAKEANVGIFQRRRNLTSAMDEMVFYWTKLATPELIQETKKKSSNSAFYLLKHVAQHWVNQLELMNTTIARAEWFSDDYQAQIDDNLSRQKWKNDLLKINEIAKDINYMRRHLNHFWRAMYLNLERLGVQLGSESVDRDASLALQGAQKDFLTIHTRMQPLRDRAEALNSVSNDLANLRAAFRGVSDGEFSLRLSLFASVVFPLTLLAGIFSMGDDFRPGKPQFYKLWAIGVPVCLVVALGLVYGRRPWAVTIDIWDYARAWLEDLKLVKPKNEKAAQKRAKIGMEEHKMEKSRSVEQESLKKRASRKNRDEEYGDC